MRSLWLLTLSLGTLGCLTIPLIFSKDAAAENVNGGDSGKNSVMTVDRKVLHEFFEKEGVRYPGVWKDDELVDYERKIRGSTGLPLIEALERCKVLYEEVAAKEKLQRLADDILLLKARRLMLLKRYGEARQASQILIEKYPEGTMDVPRDRQVCVPGVVFARYPFEHCTYYLLKYPNKTADAARLGLALCAIALKNYEEAEGILSGLVPAGEQRPPSEDPLVRPPGPDGYTAFYRDSRFRDLVAQRSDKIALFLRARVKVLQGKKDQARDLYETMLSLFPASGRRAEYELELLNSGKMDELAETVSLHLMNPRHIRARLMRWEEVLEILKLPDQAQRIEAAKAYYARFHNRSKEEVDSLRRNRDRIRSQEVNSVE